MSIFKVDIKIVTMSTYETIKKQKEEKISALITDCRMFFAFSNDQFKENQTELNPGEKILNLDNGIFVPNTELEKWISESEKIDSWMREEIRINKLEEEEILYELVNHECFYVGDVEGALDSLPFYSRDLIEKVYRKNYESHSEW